MIKQLLNKYKALPTGVRAGLWFTLCNLIRKGISFITMPIFTRIMPQADFGMYNTYISWYDFILIFSSLHLSYYVFSKGMVKFENDRDKFVLSLQSLSTTTTLIIFAFYLLFYKEANKLLGLSTSLMLCMFLHLFFEPSIEYWTARKRFEYDYVKVVTVTILVAILNPLLGIAMVYGMEDAVFARSFSAAIVVAVLGCVLYIGIQRRGKGIFTTKYWKYALLFNIPLIPHFLSSTALSQADRIMITNMAGSEYTALYSVAYSLGMVTLLFSQAIQQALLPWQYTRLKKSEYKDIDKIPTATLLILAGICLLLIAFAPELMYVIAPKSYQEAIWAIPPVCGSVFFMYLFNLFANIEYYFEETKYVAVASILAACANIGLNYIFIPIFGYVAAGYTTLFCYVLLSISHYICMKLICKKNKFEVKVYNIRMMILLSGGFLLAILLLILTYKIFIVRYLLIISVGVIAYVNRAKLKTIYLVIGKKQHRNDGNNMQ